jgi:hypothetical protein
MNSAWTRAEETASTRAAFIEQPLWWLMEPRNWQPKHLWGRDIPLFQRRPCPPDSAPVSMMLLLQPEMNLIPLGSERMHSENPHHF